MGKRAVQYGGHSFCCQFYMARTSGRYVLGRSRNERSFVFVGVGAAAEVASYAYAVLSRQCAKGRKAHMAKQPKACKTATKSARGDAYAMGWVVGVAEKILPLTPESSHAAVLERHMQSKAESLRTVKAKDRTKGANVKDQDWSEGVRDGRKVELHQGLHGAAPPAQLAHAQ